MTAIACPAPRTFNPLPLLLALLVLVAAIIYGTHAIEKHGSQAQAVRDCIANGGTMQLWVNPQTGRQAEVCQLPTGKFGIHVTRYGREVTSFIKNKLTKISQVERYLENVGYKRLYP